MQLLDPFQFRKLFEHARSFAIVGNAATILDYQHGAKIDACDVVVRFNRATTGGLEDKVGSRTDVLVVNASNSKSLAPSPAETVRPRCLVTYVSPQGVPSLRPDEFAEWVGETPILLTFGPDLIDLPAGHHTRPMTSGTYFLLTILRMFTLERVFVTGFTMFGAKGGPSQKYYEDRRAGVGTFHDLDIESQVFAALVSQSAVAWELTPEVEALVRAVEGSGAAAHPGANGKSPLRKRLAAGLAWRAVELGIRLRRFAESR